jgi:hypothetical protein
VPAFAARRESRGSFSLHEETAVSATAKKKQPDATTSRARVLSDFDTYGIKAGQIFEGEKSVMDDLTALGVVDPHPDALAYAESVDAEVVTQPTAADVEPAAE